MNYDAIVFDNDGVLSRISEMEAVYRAIARTFRDFGVDNPAEEDIERLFGVTLEDVIAVCGTYDVDPAPFWRRRDHYVAEAQIELVRSGEKTLYDDVAALDQLSGPLGVVSNNQHRTVEYLLDHYDMTDRFATIHGRRPTLGDIERKKPSPYYLLRAREDIGGQSILYVGDSPKDVIAAHRAGMDAAFVRRPHRRDRKLPERPAFEVVDLEELVAELTDERHVQAGAQE